MVRIRIPPVVIDASQDSRNQEPVWKVRGKSLSLFRETRYAGLWSIFIRLIKMGNISEFISSFFFAPLPFQTRPDSPRRYLLPLNRLVITYTADRTTFVTLLVSHGLTELRSQYMRIAFTIIQEISIEFEENTKLPGLRKTFFFFYSNTDLFWHRV